MKKREDRRKKRKRRNILILSEMVLALILLVVLIIKVTRKDDKGGEQTEPQAVEKQADSGNTGSPKDKVSGKAISFEQTALAADGNSAYMNVLAFAGQTAEGEYFSRRLFADNSSPEAGGENNGVSGEGNADAGNMNADGTYGENPTGPDAAEEEKKKDEEAFAAVLEQADLSAVMYDYDKAIETVKAFEGYESLDAAAEALARYEEEKSKLVLWPDNTTISHLFVHSLIVDTSRAFGKGSSQPKGYNMYMTTVDEFNKMLEQMYEKGYVLISIHEISKRVTDEEGNEKMVKNDIWLPEGKTPFVLSQDDVNYYQYMEKNGFADRIVLGEDGLPTCQYTDIDGNVHFGEYDMLPIVDRFVREHPDFSYHGQKGILAVTGYEGALGYDTGLSMKMYDGLSEDEKMKLIEAEREKAKAVADAIKADGWEFATHSYTHSNMTDATLSKMEYDTKRWHEEVEPIVGPTDIYIYPYGADICDWHGYKGEKFELLKKAGFWYFCNVDGNRYWIQLREQYFRMGRINADGERMNKTPERLAYFFDVDSVYDKSRPPFN